MMRPLVIGLVLLSLQFKVTFSQAALLDSIDCSLKVPTPFFPNVSWTWRNMSGFLDFFQVSAGRFASRVLVAADEGVAVSGISYALESLSLVVEYTPDLPNALVGLQRTSYDVLILPKQLRDLEAYFSDLYNSFVDFLYDGGFIILGPNPTSINTTATFIQNILTGMSSTGDSGVINVTIECGFSAVRVYTPLIRAVAWVPGNSTWATASGVTWPREHGAGREGMPTAYAANCPMAIANGTAMYVDINSQAPPAVMSFPRGRNRLYFVGLDFEADLRDGSWGALLQSIAMTAAATTPSNSSTFSSSPPPPLSATSAPQEPGLYETSSDVSSTVAWPVGRGRVSYTSAGPTATATLISPPSLALQRSAFLCHELSVNAGNLTELWVAIDLGTERRVVSVRIQAFEAGYANETKPQGVVVRLEIRVGSQQPVGSSGGLAALNTPLCPDLPPSSLTMGAEAVVGRAAVNRSCGTEGSLVGRYVTIQLLDALPSNTTWARLCGVDVMASIPASYSLVSGSKPFCVDTAGGIINNGISDYPPELHPSLAVDGLYTDNRYGGGMCALSALRQNPYFTLDLRSSFMVQRIELTKSWALEYDHQLLDFSIILSNASCAEIDNPLFIPGSHSSNLSQNATQLQVVVCASHQNLQPGTTGVYDCGGAVGRYVSVAMLGVFGYPRLCEMDVFAVLPYNSSSLAYPLAVHRSVIAAAAQLVSLMPGQANATSSSLTGLLVDGITPTTLRQSGSSTPTALASTCVIASGGANDGSGRVHDRDECPWLSIPLGDTFLVHYVQLHFREHYDTLAAGFPPATLKISSAANTTNTSTATGYHFALDVRLGDIEHVAESSSGDENPPCVVAARGLFTGLEAFTDLYGSGGEHVRRYQCGFTGSVVVVGAQRTAEDGSRALVLPPLCEVEVWGTSVYGAPIGYPSSLSRYAAASTGTGLLSTANASRALRNPNYQSWVPEETRCVVARAHPGSQAVWLLDLGVPRTITRVEILPSRNGSSTIVNVTLFNITTGIATAAFADGDPVPAPESSSPFPGGASVQLQPGIVAPIMPTLKSLAASEIGAANQTTANSNNTTANNNNITGVNDVGRVLMVTNQAPGQDLWLCQVWVYTDVAVAVGSAPLEEQPADSALLVHRRRLLVQAAGASAHTHGDAAGTIAGSFGSSHSRFRSLLQDGSPPPSPTQAYSAPLQSYSPYPASTAPTYPFDIVTAPPPAPTPYVSLGVASFAVDLGLPRSVEAAVLVVSPSSAGGVTGTYQEMTGLVPSAVAYVYDEDEFAVPGARKIASAWLSLEDPAILVDAAAMALERERAAGGGGCDCGCLMAPQRHSGTYLMPIGESVERGVSVGADWSVSTPGGGLRGGGACNRGRGGRAPWGEGAGRKAQSGMVLSASRPPRQEAHDSAGYEGDNSFPAAPTIPVQSCAGAGGGPRSTADGIALAAAEQGKGCDVDKGAPIRSDPKVMLVSLELFDAAGSGDEGREYAVPRIQGNSGPQALRLGPSHKSTGVMGASIRKCVRHADIEDRGCSHDGSPGAPPHQQFRQGPLPRLHRSPHVMDLPSMPGLAPSDSISCDRYTDCDDWIEAVALPPCFTSGAVMESTCRYTDGTTAAAAAAAASWPQLHSMPIVEGKREPAFCRSAATLTLRTPTAPFTTLAAAGQRREEAQVVDRLLSRAPAVISTTSGPPAHSVTYTDAGRSAPINYTPSPYTRYVSSVPVPLTMPVAEALTGNAPNTSADANSARIYDNRRYDAVAYVMAASQGIPGRSVRGSTLTGAGGKEHPNGLHARDQNLAGRPGANEDGTRGPQGSGRVGDSGGRGQDQQLNEWHVMRSLEVRERYGQLFEEMHGDRVTAVTFQAALYMNTLVPAALLGAQAGGDLEPGSTTARALNITLLSIKGLFAVYLTIILPYTNAVAMAVEFTCVSLETAVCACLVALQWSASGPRLSDVMMACEVTVLVLQGVRLLVVAVLPAAFAVATWIEQKRQRRGASRP